MSKLRAAVEKARDKFLFYRDQHMAKGTPDADAKAVVNQNLADEMQEALDDTPHDILALERVQDYRFGSLMKGEHYSFARGLTINPTHLPAALDAMQRDGFELVSIFGEATSDKMGFIFRMIGPNKRVDELLAANTKLVLEKRELKEKYDELKFRMDGLEK
jgi:hypothetical protein